ncbi:MAG: sorbosone dehydrogenase family protein [Flavobacteriales bacterium]|nr:sorbosone dehydrogenase family protein [Flavobacteriales bacterium]
MRFSVLFLVILLSISARAQKIQDMLHLIKLPEGFKIELYATEVENARSLAQGPKGVIFVGSRNEGKVYAVVDEDGDWKSDKTYVLAEGLNQPNGVAYRDGDLYIAEISAVSVMRGIDDKLANPPNMQTIRDDFPTEKHHGWKYIAFGPDGKLYVPIGAPCNICLSEDERFASITRMNADGSDFEVFAHGIRNSVGFDWHPKTKELWFTDNGRDWFGENKPNDELNHAPEKGMHFGYPHCHAGQYADPKFGDKRSCDEFIAPAQKLGAHVASLGITFIEKDVFPEEYRKSIFIAEHGSWNKTVPDGYRITRVELNGNESVKYEVFADGWLNGAERLGRPVDILEMEDGSLLVSDDYANCIYRITYIK